MSFHYMVPLAAYATLAAFALTDSGCSGGGQSSVSPKTSDLPIGNTHPGYCQVTGEKVNLAKATLDIALHSDYQGKRYLFCCQDCKPDFDKDPRKYIENPVEPEQEKESNHAGHKH